MGSISQLFVLSGRGDTIIVRQHLQKRASQPLSTNPPSFRLSPDLSRRSTAATSPKRLRRRFSARSSFGRARRRLFSCVALLSARGIRCISIAARTSLIFTPPPVPSPPPPSPIECRRRELPLYEKERHLLCLDDEVQRVAVLHSRAPRARRKGAPASTAAAGPTSLSRVRAADASNTQLFVLQVFKDYCGVLSEESIRKNFILLYELLDEMIVRGALRGRRAAPSVSHPTPSHPHHNAMVQDYGYPQSTSTESLKMYVHNEPIAVESMRSAGSGLLASKKTISSSAVQKPSAYFPACE